MASTAVLCLYTFFIIIIINFWHAVGDVHGHRLPGSSGSVAGGGGRESGVSCSVHGIPQDLSVRVQLGRIGLSNGFGRHGFVFFSVASFFDDIDCNDKGETQGRRGGRERCYQSRVASTASATNASGL